MAELLEYFLALGVGSVLAVASLGVYVQFSSFEAGVQFHALFADLTTLSSQALANGTAAARLTLPRLAIDCSGGVLTLSAGSLVQSANIGSSCSFNYDIGPGAHLLTFSREEAGLTLRVE